MESWEKAIEDTMHDSVVDNSLAVTFRIIRLFQLPEMSLKIESRYINTIYAILRFSCRNISGY